MLVLSRKIGERILIEPGIEIAIVEVHGGKVRIGIAAAPPDIRTFTALAPRSPIVAVPCWQARGQVIAN